MHTIEALLHAHPEAQQILDDLVHDQASNLATAVNNDGLKAQVEFLESRGMYEDDIRAHLAEATAE